jgi:glycine oxidase ThiO
MKQGGASDALVIGGGIAGLSIAWRLAQRGLAVRLVEAVRPGAGASGAAAGMLPPAIESFGLPGAHPDLYALLSTARARWPDFAAELEAASGQSVGYSALGALIVARDTAGLSRLDSLARAAAEWGEPIETLDAAAARLAEPLLAVDCLGGVLLPRDALVDPPLVIAALRIACLRAGVMIETARITRIEQTAAGPRAYCAEAFYEAGAIVLAPGWPGAAGVALAPELAAVTPIKGQILTISGRGAPLRRMLRGQGFYAAPRADGRIEIGATSEPGRDDSAIDPQAMQALLRAAARVVPMFAQAAVLASRAGVRPGSPDHAPLLGESTLKGLFLAAGLHRNGVLLAPLIAELLAGAVSGERSPWLERLRPGRFMSA